MQELLRLTNIATDKAGREKTAARNELVRIKKLLKSMQHELKQRQSLLTRQAQLAEQRVAAEKDKLIQVQQELEQAKNNEEAANKIIATKELELTQKQQNIDVAKAQLQEIQQANFANSRVDILSENNSNLSKRLRQHVALLESMRWMSGGLSAFAGFLAGALGPVSNRVATASVGLAVPLSCAALTYGIESVQQERQAAALRGTLYSALYGAGYGLGCLCKPGIFLLQNKN